MGRVGLYGSVLAVVLCGAGAFSGPGAAMADLLSLERIGGYGSGAPFDEGGAEIVAYHAAAEGRRLTAYVTNGFLKGIDIVDLTDPADPRLIRRVDLSLIGGSPTGGPTSVAVDPRGRGIAAAAPHADKQSPGWVALMNLDGDLIETVSVGALPDMLTFTPDGAKILVANEGEPNDDYTVDPEGSVSIIDLSEGFSPAGVATAGFHGVPMTGGVRIFGPGATPAQDLEPEYIAVAPDGRRAFVSLQENNALAELDLDAGRFVAVRGLGYKDHRRAHHRLDASDKDGEIHLRPWPVFGMYQPDGIAVYTAGGKSYVVTANEGDARDYAGFSEEARVKSLFLDPSAFPNEEILKRDEKLGRLKVTTIRGDLDGDGDFDRLHSFGARSFSLFEVGGPEAPAFDSGDDFETIVARRLPSFFNSDNDDNDSFDGRSDDKGPEPEGVTLGRLDGRTFAFIGLERVGGVVAYEITDPRVPAFAGYVNSRNFSVPADSPEAGDLGPEGLAFVPAAQSPTGEALLLAAHEVSGTVAVYRVVRGDPPAE